MNLARYVARGAVCALVPFAIAACGDDDEGTPDGTTGGNDADASSETQPDGQTGVTSCDFPFVLVDAEAGTFSIEADDTADWSPGLLRGDLRIALAGGDVVFTETFTLRVERPVTR